MSLCCPTWPWHPASLAGITSATLPAGLMVSLLVGGGLIEKLAPRAKANVVLMFLVCLSLSVSVIVGWTAVVEYGDAVCGGRL